MIDYPTDWQKRHSPHHLPLAGMATILLLLLTLAAGDVARAATVRQSGAVSITILTTAVNLRSGPDKVYPTVGTAQRGENLVVLSHYNNCAWLQVRTGQNVEGWVTGKRQFVRLNGTCEALGGTSSAPAAPATSLPTALPETSTPPITAASIIIPPTPTIAAPVPTTVASPPVLNDELAQKVPLDAGKGCYLFQNFLGREILITLTNQEVSYSVEFRLVGYSEDARCLPPGQYNFTLSAAGYQSHNNSFRVHAGVRDYFQINGRN